MKRNYWVLTRWNLINLEHRNTSQDLWKGRCWINVLLISTSKCSPNLVSINFMVFFWHFTNQYNTFDLPCDYEMLYYYNHDESVPQISIFGAFWVYDITRWECDIKDQNFFTIPLDVYFWDVNKEKWKPKMFWSRSYLISCEPTRAYAAKNPGKSRKEEFLKPIIVLSRIAFTFNRGSNDTLDLFDRFQSVDLFFSKNEKRIFILKFWFFCLWSRPFAIQPRQ
jgi:hypothetical protein